MVDQAPVPRPWIWRTLNAGLVVFFIAASWVAMAFGLTALAIGAFYAAEGTRALVIGDLGWWPATFAGLLTFLIFLVCGLLGSYKVTNFLVGDQPMPVVKNGRTQRQSIPEHELPKTRPSPAEIERRGMGRG